MIYHIFISKDILLVSTGARHMPYGYSLLFNHRGIYMDILLVGLFRSKSMDPTSTVQMDLWKDKPDTKTTYIYTVLMFFLIIPLCLYNKGITTNNETAISSSNHKEHSARYQQHNDEMIPIYSVSAESFDCTVDQYKSQTADGRYGQHRTRTHDLSFHLPIPAPMLCDHSNQHHR